jgi:hypothetical protein
LTQYNIVSGASLVAGQPEDISIVLANLQAIAAVINGSLDNANLAANAGIAASKLQGYPGDATKALLGDGNWGAVSPARLGEAAQSVADWNLAKTNGWYMAGPATPNAPETTKWYIGEVITSSADWVIQRLTGLTDPAGGIIYERRWQTTAWTSWYIPSGVLERFATDNQIISSAAEASLYSATAHSGTTGWTIPAGIGANRMLRWSARGDALYNNSDSDNGTLRIRVGGANLAQTSDMFGPGGPSATRDEWWANCYVVLDGAANVQRAWGWYQGSRQANPNPMYVYGAVGAVDTTAPWKLDFTFQWSTASANNAFRHQYSLLEII